jgi:hypothetical protein
MYNGNFFGVQRVAVVDRFDCIKKLLGEHGKFGESFYVIVLLVSHVSLVLLASLVLHYFVFINY